MNLAAPEVSLDARCLGLAHGTVTTRVLVDVNLTHPALEWKREPHLGAIERLVIEIGSDGRTEKRFVRGAGKFQ